MHVTDRFSGGVNQDGPDLIKKHLLSASGLQCYAMHGAVVDKLAAGLSLVQVLHAICTGYKSTSQHRSQLCQRPMRKVDCELALMPREVLSQYLRGSFVYLELSTRRDNRHA